MVVPILATSSLSANYDEKCDHSEDSEADHYACARRTAIKSLASCSATDEYQNRRGCDKWKRCPFSFTFRNQPVLFRIDSGEISWLESDFRTRPDIFRRFFVKFSFVRFFSFLVPIGEFLAFGQPSFCWFVSESFAKNFLAESVEVAASVEHVQMPSLINFVARSARVPCGDAEVGESFIFVDDPKGVGV